MVPNIPGSTPLAQAAVQEPQATEVAGPSQARGQTAGAYTGFDRLKQRMATCLPCGGPPGGADVALRPRVELPRPVRGQLLWPDGHRSSGKVLQTQEGPVFEVASRRRDPVLAQRGHHKTGRPRDAAAAPLPVVAAAADPSGRKFVPRLPLLPAGDFYADGRLKLDMEVSWLPPHEGAVPESVRLPWIRREEISAIVINAGGAPRGAGLKSLEHVAQKRLFGRSLQAVAPYCSDPQRARNVADALLGADSALWLRPRPAGTGPDAGWNVLSNVDASAVPARLAALAPGQIWHMRVVQEDPSGTGDHYLGIALERQADERFRLSVVNSNGWLLATRGQDGDVPGVFRTVDIDAAAATLQDLLCGRLPDRPAEVPERHWTQAPRARMVLEWWRGADAVDPRLSADFHGTGDMLRSARQKYDDCSAESLFAFLATALTPPDYKLAKAACLNTLVQIADRLEPPGTAAPDAPLQVARRRLQERITSSLGGHMVAQAGGAVHLPA
jgi:hypothetical protein